ncbi:hypothetical protein PVAND_014346 [Polypedilum vanderplanki]|uniref:Uncharacterized protein n=1 Tax=Polypedilum vanderplanki TaxID=319348 RepID=A0A9J6CS24_POLVA|nr:hypothetical protein PVAND_014346 [Polypedilum vanderplanki]
MEQCFSMQQVILFCPTGGVDSYCTWKFTIHRSLNHNSNNEATTNQTATTNSFLTTTEDSHNHNIFPPVPMKLVRDHKATPPNFGPYYLHNELHNSIAQVISTTHHYITLSKLFRHPPQNAVFSHASSTSNIHMVLPASGPASSSLDVIGLESRGNSVIVEPKQLKVMMPPKLKLPGLQWSQQFRIRLYISNKITYTRFYQTSQSAAPRNLRNFQLNFSKAFTFFQIRVYNACDYPNHHHANIS